MASKGQKFKKYDAKLKRKILRLLETKKYSQGYLSKRYNIPKGTIAIWVYKSKRGIDICVNNWKGHCGRKCLTNDDYKEKYEILKKFQDFINARRKKK